MTTDSAVARLDGSAADLLDRRAPIRAGASIVLAAPAAAIWVALVDINAWSSWYHEIKDTRAKGPIEHGTKFSFKAGPASLTARVDELVEAERLKFRARARGSSSDYVFQLSQDGGRTEVSAAQTMKGMTAVAMKPMMQGIAEKAVVRWLDALRDHLKA